MPGMDTKANFLKCMTNDQPSIKGSFYNSNITNTISSSSVTNTEILQQAGKTIQSMSCN